MVRITLKACKTLTVSADEPQALSIYTMYKTLNSFELHLFIYICLGSYFTSSVPVCLIELTSEIYTRMTWTYAITGSSNLQCIHI